MHNLFIRNIKAIYPQKHAGQEMDDPSAVSYPVRGSKGYVELY